jgi:glucosyl-3-phosphoglycerate synthase
MSDMTETSDGSVIIRDAAEWFRHRSYDYRQFSDLEALARRKRELDLTVSAVLPCRNVADTVGGIIDEIHAVNRQTGDHPLVDQILAVDADSPDGTALVAASRGAEVYSENELMSNHGGAHGKGDAMWRALSVALGDLVMYIDTDTKDFGPQLVYGILDPIFEVPEIRFVKAAYRRPFKSHETVELDGGGRVTELSTKPLFNLFYPELAGFAQPLAGEFVADRELFSSISFLTGYAVETGIMIDVLKMVGLDAMAQVDLGTRQNRHQPLRDLSPHVLLGAADGLKAHAPGRTTEPSTRPRLAGLPLPALRLPARRSHARRPQAPRVRRGARRAAPDQRSRGGRSRR